MNFLDFKNAMQRACQVAPQARIPEIKTALSKPENSGA